MFIAIDLGKTTTRVASSRDLRVPFKIEKFPTLPNLIEEKAAIKSAIGRVSDSEKTNLAVVAMPGIIDRNGQSFYRVNIYPELIGKHFSEFTNGCIECPQILVENDALIAGYAEAVGGAGKEFDVVAYLTLSTGVGGVRIAFKEIDFSYYYSEPGHQIIVHNGREDRFCGNKGCFQSYVSGPAFEEIYKVKPENCVDEGIWDNYAENLASGINNIISMWAPEVIVIGGGLSQKFDFFYPGLMERLKTQYLFPLPEIRKSAFGDDSGIRGAIMLMQKLTEKVA